MGDFLCRGGAHVTGRTCRVEIIFSGMPLLRRSGELHLLFVGLKHDAMLALKIGLDLRMVRPHMAATAILRLPGLSDRETVPCVTSRAGTFRAIWIHPPNA